MRKSLIALAAISFCNPVSVGATPEIEDWEAIDERAALLAASDGHQAHPIDRRIRLARCPQPVVIANAPAGLALDARCDALGWKIRIPMRAAQSAAASGARNSVALVPLVRRGDLVRMRIETESFAISHMAVAMQDGRMGDVIPLRAEGSKLVINAEVSGARQVRVID